MLYQIDMESFFLYQICNSYFSVTFVTPVTCPLEYIPINMALERAPQIVEGALYQLSSLITLEMINLDTIKSIEIFSL